MSPKKPTGKVKEKTSHQVEAAPKRKPAIDEKEAGNESKPAMDVRANRDRRDNDRRQTEKPVAVERRSTERRAKVNRRRQIDPTTCERDYSVEEVEFMSALDDYKRRSGRMFPTCSEILEVFKGLGYEKHAESPVDMPVPMLDAEQHVAEHATTEQAV